MTFDTVMVLTSRSLETIIREGGTGNWKANERSVRRCRWVVAVRNRHSNWSEGDEDHGAAFLIGRVAGVKPSPKPEEKDRLVIMFDRYALLNKPTAWPSDHRNPVAYTMLESLKISPEKLEWKDVSSDVVQPVSPEAPVHSPASTVEDARIMIARAFSIDPSAVKISIDV